MSQAKPLTNSFRQGPDDRGHFGLFGGRYVAETLMPLILEVEKAYNATRADAVVVGSAIVQQIEVLTGKKMPPAQIVEKVSAFVEGLCRATHEARGKAAA